MKLSDIIGKQVFDIFDATFLGTIHEVNFDKNYTKVLGFYFFDQEENEFYLKKQDIYSVGDYVTIKNANKTTKNFEIFGNLLPFGKYVVSLQGEDLGNLCDIELDDKFEITNFCTQKQKINPKDIMVISENIVVGDKKICMFAIKNKKTNMHKLNNINVAILKMEDVEQQGNTPKLMPSKITVNSDVLLGKKLSKDIIGKNNELILKQDQVITPKLVLIAKQHEKLNELFYSVY